MHVHTCTYIPDVTDMPLLYRPATAATETRDRGPRGWAGAERGGGGGEVVDGSLQPIALPVAAGLGRPGGTPIEAGALSQRCGERAAVCCEQRAAV